MVQLKFYHNESYDTMICLKIIEDILNKFFASDIVYLENRLNDKRKFYLIEWSNKDFVEDKIIYKDEEYRIEKGMCELSTPFRLRKPEKINIHIKQNSEGSIVPAKTRSFNGKFFVDTATYKFDNVDLVVYISMLSLDSDNVYWKEGHMTLEDIICHELIHLCGDIICDGKLRIDMVGVEIIKEIL